jgi:tetratricopeptide (TPR) repeat protein
VKYLKAHQLYDRSTIVLASDHGEGLGDHGERGHGLFLYDEAIHVPLIVKQAAGLSAGRRVADLVQHIDLVPTILELVKAPIPGNVRGRSLRPLLDGSGRLAETRVYSEAHYGHLEFGWSPLAALSDSRFKYISAPREELFDLRRDPRERMNVAADFEKDRNALAGALAQLLAGHTSKGPANAATAAIDPKDMYEIVETYRAAAELTASRKWAPAIRLLQSIAKKDDAIAQVWSELGANAMRIERFDQAADAYSRACELEPDRASRCLGAAAAFLKLKKPDDARARATTAADAATDRSDRAAAHELLARIAVARHDAEVAREEAELARQADPTRPVPAFIESRLLFDQGRFADALPFAEEAIQALQKSHGRPIADLHFSAAEMLVRLDRPAEAAAQYVEELRAFPQNARASAALAGVYHTTGQSDDADRVLTEMIETTPTPETYALAARLWTAFGDARQAAAARADARKAFPDGR